MTNIYSKLIMVVKAIYIDKAGIKGAYKSISRIGYPNNSSLRGDRPKDNQRNTHRDISARGIN